MMPLLAVMQLAFSTSAHIEDSSDWDLISIKIMQKPWTLGCYQIINNSKFWIKPTKHWANIKV